MKITTSIKPLENSEIEITGEINAADFSAFKTKALTNLNQQAKIDGFRPGHVPEAVLIQTLGEDAILFEMADLALREAYPQIIIDEKIDALGRPNIQITKIAKDNPLGFKIITAVHPVVTFGDYKKAVKKVLAEPLEVAVVTDEDVAKVLEEVRQNYAHHEYHQAHPEDNNHDHSELPLPKLTDEFAKKVGPFADLADLQTKIKANLTTEKEREQANKRRVKVIDALVSETTVVPPQILIDHELDSMLSELKGRIEAAGLKFDDYLAHLKKTETEVRDGWKDEAKKQVTIALAIAEIAKVEKIEISTDDLERDTKGLMEQYKDINPDRARDYVANLLINQKVLAYLEGLK